MKQKGRSVVALLAVNESLMGWGIGNARVAETNEESPPMASQRQ
jgi:hypothetical protein